MLSLIKYILPISFVALLLVSCDEKSPTQRDEEVLVSTDDCFKKSSSAGNLIATAIKEENDLDFALVPSSALVEGEFSPVKENMDSSKVESFVSNLVKDNYKTYVVGAIKGEALKKFIGQRTLDMGNHDLHVAGLRYDVKLLGGRLNLFQIVQENGDEIEDDRYYRIAIDEFGYNYKNVFPGYYYGYGFNRSFLLEKEKIDLASSLEGYLSKVRNFKKFDIVRSSVSTHHKNEIAGVTPISKVQGISHLSPYQGHIVTVEGVVTAVAKIGDGFFKGQYEAFIQSVEPDSDPRSSEGLYVGFGDFSASNIAVGNKIKVKGVVYEDLSAEGMTRTGIREIQSVEVLEEVSAVTPEAVVLGEGIKVPTEKISSYKGNLNRKESLNLQDGIDFWESLEGMKIVARTPSVVGFSGGKNDYNSTKGYISLFIVADQTASKGQVTPVGGVMINNVENDFNPEIIRVVDHHMAKEVKSSKVFEVGQKLSHDVEGIMSFEKNSFGSGEYALLVTGKLESDASLKNLDEKPVTRFVPEDKKLSFSTFNVENLSSGDSDDDERFEQLGIAISKNLKCPDIVNLVEIQDNSGSYEYNTFGSDGDSDVSASKTLSKLIDSIKDCPIPAEYEFINIDPIANTEGGEPGGNIRVAMIYNAKRVTFNRRGNAGATDETFLDENGSLTLNPGRVAPNDPRFAGTRKSLISEFEFRGEKVFVVGNHFNSKGGDTSMWASSQPAVLHTESKRLQIADAVNDYLEVIVRDYPEANIIVAGDFNDFNESRALKALAGDVLTNLANAKDQAGEWLIDPLDLYTYNFGGNSQPLDFILTSQNLLKKNPQIQVVHINTDYMGQVSDHDPVIAQFLFD